MSGGNILGGKQDGRGEYSSQEMYGIRRYPDTLRMMSQEVEDVMKSRVAPLDVLRLRVPHCSMPAPEADQARITPAYHEDKGEAREFLRCALAARKRYGYFDCSTCPERLIFDHLWIDDSEYVADSKVPSNPFANQWSFADSTELEKWSQMLHVDVWGIAQEIQRKGVESEIILLEIAKRDSGRRVWPVSLVRHPAPNQASSSAVGMALDRYPWVDSGLRWKGTMVYKESPGEDRSTLFESARKPGVNPLSGPASSSQDASSSPAPPAKAMPDALSKADSSTGKAASSGRPASEPDVKDKGQGTSVPKSSAPARATSDSGISAPTKEQDKPVGPIASSTAVSQSTPSPKPASSVTSTTAAMDSVPKAKAPSGAASMPAPKVGSTGGSERGVQSAPRAPSGAASQSSVTAGSGYPTIAWLGAGLIWKRVHASSPVDRIQTEAPDRMRRPRVVPTREEKIASGPLPPWKALPLVLPWDKSYRDTYHVDFDPSMAHHDLSWRCPMTSLAYEDYSNPDVMHGEVSPDRPWMLSPPEIPLAGRDKKRSGGYKGHGIPWNHLFP